jgi:hypothetical protein
MTEADAKERQCPWAKEVIDPVEERDWTWDTDSGGSGATVAIAGVSRVARNLPHDNTMCLASGCMAWGLIAPSNGTDGFCSAGDKNVQDWR